MGVHPFSARGYSMKPCQFLASALFLLSACLLPAQQVDPHPILKIRPSLGIDDAFNQEAADRTPQGTLQLSYDLIGVLTAEKSGEDYRLALAHRLADAEQAVRGGHGHLIPEANVARAFNQLMQKIHAPFRADEASIHAFRQRSVQVPSYTNLLTADRNPTACTPAEALFLFNILMWNSGKAPQEMIDWYRARKQLAEHPEEAANWHASVSGHVEKITDDAAGCLAFYKLRHKPEALIKTSSQTVQKFGF